LLVIAIGVPCDCVQPGREARIATERADPRQRLDEHLLRQVAGEIVVAAQAAGPRHDTAMMPVEQYAEADQWRGARALALVLPNQVVGGWLVEKTRRWPLAVAVGRGALAADPRHVTVATQALRSRRD